MRKGHIIKTLIFRLSSIGDIVLTGPFIRRLKEAYSAAHVTYVTRTEFAPLVRSMPHVDAVLPLDTVERKVAMSEMRDQLRGMKFDHVFDFHNNLRTRFLRKGLSGTLHVYRKSHWRWMLLVALKINRYPEIVPVAERYFRAANIHWVTPDTLPPELHIPAGVLIPSAGAHDAGVPFRIALCPGAKHFTKRYPLHHAMAVARLLLNESDAQIAVLGGPEDRALGETIAALDNTRITNFCGALSLMGSAAVLKQCAAAVSNDSGLMHIATAVGTPVVALFGSTVREFGFFPYNAPAAVLEVTGLGCRPCTHIGRDTCPKGHFKCMEEIPPETVCDTVLAFVKR